MPSLSKCENMKASVVCRQETELETISNVMIMQTLGLDFPAFAYLPASQTAQLTLAGTNETSWLASVYGPQDRRMVTKWSSYMN